MTSICKECGAAYPDEETCEERFYVCQQKELDDPAYYAVHLLSVACYMMQHNRYSRQGWLGARELVEQHLRQGVSAQELRRRNRDGVDSGRRDWSITRGERLPGVESIHWRVTQAHIRHDTAEHYCADVRHWAATVLEDSQALVEGSS